MPFIICYVHGEVVQRGCDVLCGDHIISTVVSYLPYIELLDELDIMVFVDE